jgi:hypothetical protein
MSPDAHAEKVNVIRGFHADSLKSEDPNERLAAGIAAALTAGFRENSAPLSRLHTSGSVNRTRTIGRVLLTRAYLRIEENDIPGAQSDLLAIRRIARLLGQGMGYEWLVGTAFDEMASYGDVCLLESGKLTEEACRRHLEDLSKLPPLPSTASIIDLEDRPVALDAMQFTAIRWQEAIGSLQSLNTEFDESSKDAMRAIDWTLAMKVLNQKFDAHVAAAKDMDPVKRKAIMEQRVPQRLGKEEEEFIVGIAQAAKEGPEELSRFMGEVYFDRHSLPIDTGMRSRAHFDVVRAGYAAYLYRFREGSHPDSVDLLTPILNEFPIDRFTGEPLKLRVVDDGIVIYSVGTNRIDDGGVPIEENHRKDDLRIRVFKTLADR